MDKLPVSKKAVLYIGQFLATAIMYGVVMYLLDQFFESDHRYSMRSIAIQSVVFGLLFTLWSTWSTNLRIRKRKQRIMNKKYLLLLVSLLFASVTAFAQHEILDYSMLTTADNLYEYEETDLVCQRDTLNMFGKIYRPLTPYSHKLPVIIHAHGYNSSHGEPEPYAKGLAKSGYANVIFDFCGGGNASKSDGKTTDMSVFTEQRDVESVIDLLSTFDWVDMNQIYLMGYSQGGLVSSITAVANPDKIAGLILVYPALLIPDHARNIHPKEAWTAESYPVMGMDLSHVYYDKLLDYDVYEDVKKYKGPVCIIYGDKDSVTAFNSMERAEAAYTTTEFHVIENGTHGFPPSEHKIATINYALDFLKKNVK